MRVGANLLISLKTQFFVIIPLEVRRNFFNVRATKTWNGIPDTVRQKKTVNAFKSAYDDWKKKKQPNDGAAMP